MKFKQLTNSVTKTLLLAGALLAAGILPARSQWAVGEWHQWSTNGHYYSVQQITGSDNSWFVARSQARNLMAPNGQPADLATITSAEENDFVFSGIDDPAYWAIDPASHNEGPYLGGYQYDKLDEPAGHWAWVTGEPWSYTNWSEFNPKASSKSAPKAKPSWSYTNWSEFNPNNFGGDEDYVCFFSLDGSMRASTWNDDDTSTVVQYYVAEATEPQSCTPPPTGMVAWWLGDGNANDIQDGNDGTLQNGATFGTGEVGQAFSFDGTDNFVERARQRSVELWRQRIHD
jgi:hypothetical protein